MKKIFSVLMVFTLCVFTVSGVFANYENPSDKPTSVKVADSIIKSSKTYEERIERLKKVGWEAVRVGREESDLSMDSLGSCAETPIHTVLKYWDDSRTDYVYLIQVDWEFNDGSGDCDWDNKSKYAHDGYGLAVVDQDGNSVDRQAEYPNIEVRDEDGDVHDVGWVDSIVKSGAKYVFKDSDTLTDEIGSHGSAWFYTEAPTSGSKYYVKSRWIHNWAEETTDATYTLSYPFAFSVTYSDSTVVQDWGLAHQSIVTFD